MGACPLGKILEFRTSEIESTGFSGQVSVAKIIDISSIEEALVAIQLSRKLLPVLNVLYTYRQARPSNPCLFRSRADSFTCGANLKL